MPCKVNRFAQILLLGFSAYLVASPLMGQNRIPARDYDWKTLTTDRFVIYYPDGYLSTALFCAGVAEDAADRLQVVLRHNLSRRVPIFLYPSFQDFQATGILPYAIDEGTGGFTDYYKERVVLPFNGNRSETKHVLVHELVHAFQFDLLGGNFGAYPLWLMEGMAEYLSIGPDASMDEYVRDLVISGRMPDVLDLQMGGGFMNYKGGQSIMHFIAGRWGAERIGVLLREMAVLRRFDLSFRSAFEMDFFSFNLQYRSYLERTYGPAMAFHEKTEGLQRVTFRYHDRSGFQYKPALSPDGKTAAYLSFQGLFPALVLRRMPGPGISERDQEERRVLIRYLRSPDYEEWQPMSTRLSFSPDGRSVLFATRNRAHQALAIVSVSDGALLQLFQPPVDTITDPIFSPDGRSIVFTASVRGRPDLVLLDRQSGAIHPLTDDPCFEDSARFSSDGRSVLFSSCAARANEIEGSDRDIYSVPVSGGSPVRVLRLPGRQSYPASGDGGTILFISDHEGVRNVYRFDPTHPGKAIEAVTALNTDVLHLDVRTEHGEVLLFSRREEGAVELYRAAAPSVDGDFYARYGGADPGKTRLISVSTEGLRSTRQTSTALVASEFRATPRLYSIDAPYRPQLEPIGSPFLFVTGASDSKGNSAVAFLAFGALQDLKGDHSLEAFVSYQDRPSFLNGDVRYIYSRYRVHAGLAAYSYNGVFAAFNPMDFSLNNIIYNPYVRLSSMNATGLAGWLDYPLHAFGRVRVSVETGRDELVYLPATPEQPEREDVYRNRQTLGAQYVFDNAAYTLYGPLDGHAVLLSMQAPVRTTGTERDVYRYIAEFRAYHMFEDYSLFAFRAFAGTSTGPDAKDYPFRVGGYYSIRGYEFQEFEGRYAAFVNLEYRFTFIEHLIFGFPTRWSPGLIRGAVFVDAGAAFDNPATFQAVDGHHTRDLRASTGIGLHWANFLWFVLPGAMMKVEWASPWDGARTLPFSQWQGRFSVGYQF